MKPAGARASAAGWRDGVWRRSPGRPSHRHIHVTNLGETKKKGDSPKAAPKKAAQKEGAEEEDENDEEQEESEYDNDEEEDETEEDEEEGGDEQEESEEENETESKTRKRPSSQLNNSNKDKMTFGDVWNADWSGPIDWSSSCE